MEQKLKQQNILGLSLFVREKQKLLDNAYGKHFSSQNLNKESTINILLYDEKEILFNTVGYIKNTKCFERPPIDHC